MRESLSLTFGFFKRVIFIFKKAKEGCDNSAAGRTFPLHTTDQKPTPGIPDGPLRSTF